jgi:hypothetical protein
MLGSLAALWALEPLGLWLTAGLLSLVGEPVLTTALPASGMAVLRLLLPALLAGVALYRQQGQSLPQSSSRRSPEDLAL